MGHLPPLRRPQPPVPRGSLSSSRTPTPATLQRPGLALPLRGRTGPDRPQCSGMTGRCAAFGGAWPSVLPIELCQSPQSRPQRQWAIYGGGQCPPLPTGPHCRTHTGPRLIAGLLLPSRHRGHGPALLRCPPPLGPAPATRDDRRGVPQRRSHPLPCASCCGGAWASAWDTGPHTGTASVGLPEAPIARHQNGRLHL